jgi:hypothetical protein
MGSNYFLRQGTRHRGQKKLAPTPLLGSMTPTLC